MNGADTLEFKLPFHDPKRSTLENEKQVQIVNDIYRIRTLTDNKSEDGRVITQVYAEAVFYDLSFSAEKEPREFNADTADVPMQYALLGTGWTVGNVTVTTKRTWQCTEKMPYPSFAPYRIFMAAIWCLTAPTARYTF